MKTWPKWLDEDWLAKNRDTLFVKRLRNAADQLSSQIEFGSSDDSYPFGMTGEDMWLGIRTQFREAKKETALLNDNDRKQADEALQKFNSHYQELIKSSVCSKDRVRSWG